MSQHQFNARPLREGANHQCSVFNDVCSHTSGRSRVGGMGDNGRPRILFGCCR